jgi:peptidoglycan/xylan/chitin deacetylase (PgdA/CDA1 family)
MQMFFYLLTFVFLFSGEDPVDQYSSKDQKTVVCFIYHRFDDSRYPSTNTSAKDFESHLRYLAENHFQVLSLSEAFHYLRSDEPAQRTAVITIDDGFRSFYENGLPLLKHYHMPATLFINTGTVGAGDYMSWQQLKEAMHAHIEIGNHTETHPYFLNQPSSTRYAMLEKEIKDSQNRTRKNLDVTPAVFAYPYGEFDEGMKSVVKKAGFVGAAAQFSGVIYEATDRFEIPRFPVAGTFSDPANFTEKAMMKPLKITRQSPENTLLSAGDLRPKLTLSFFADDLQIDQLQCFIQGGDCEKEITANGKEVTVTLRSSSDISSRRRTLYTVTVPDKAGAWHWYSHLWINNHQK